MQINNIHQINPKPVSFGAKIVITKELRNAINHVKENYSVERKNEVYNALSLIFNEDAYKIFQIKVHKKNHTDKIYKINIKKKLFSSTKNLNCIDSIKNFIYEFYGTTKGDLELKRAKISTIKNYRAIRAKYNNIENFEKEEAQKIIADVDKYTSQAHKELNTKLDIIMLQSRFGYNGE